MSKKYGLTKLDLSSAREKIKLQKDYLEKNEILTSNGQFKKLIDLSFSANHSYRYYAQLANKVNTMEQLAHNKGLTPIFLTMTLDGFYRDLLQGDYRRYYLFSDEKIFDILKSVPNDDARGFIRDKLRAGEKLTVKDLYNVLNYQMKQFRQSYAFKTLKKNNHEYMYIKTVEPHKDGVPHFHMMLFIPSSYIDIFHKYFKSSFIAPRNSHDTAFQIDIDSASAYIMKYITKSFIDVRDQKDLDYLSAWFVKHRIMRCVTSRSLIPQWVYKICSIYEKDWYYLTDILSSPKNESEWSREHNCFWIYDTWSDREICYEYGKLSLYSKGRLIKTMGVPVQKHIKVNTYDKVPKFWHKENKPIPILQNDKITHFYKNGNIKEYKKKPYQMNDYEIYTYFENLDIETVDEKHYLYTRNLLIERGLIDGHIMSLTAYDDLINDFESEGVF